MKSQEFESAKTELDELTRMGYFGEISKENLKKKESLSRKEFLHETLVDSFRSEKHKPEMARFIINFMDLIIEGFEHDIFRVGDIVYASEHGTVDHPELETISSYTRFLESNHLFKSSFHKAKTMKRKGGSKLVEAEIELSRSLLTLYSDGFEYDMKIFTYLLSIIQVINERKNSIFTNSNLFSSNKVNQFRQLDTEKSYGLLTDHWDWRLRNADDHLDIRFNISDKKYTGKNRYREQTNDGNMIIISPFSLSMQDLYDDVVFISRFTLGFLQAVPLLYLATQSKAMYMDAVMRLTSRSLIRRLPFTYNYNRMNNWFDPEE